VDSSKDGLERALRNSLKHHIMRRGHMPPNLRPLGPTLSELSTMQAELDMYRTQQASMDKLRQATNANSTAEEKAILNEALAAEPGQNL